MEFFKLTRNIAYSWKKTLFSELEKTLFSSRIEPENGGSGMFLENRDRAHGSYSICQVIEDDEMKIY